MPDFANPRRFVLAVKILVLSTKIVRLPPPPGRTDRRQRATGHVQEGASSPAPAGGLKAETLCWGALRGAEGTGGNPAGNGFHQNGLEGIQGSKRDEPCLPRTDVCARGGRPLLKTSRRDAWHPAPPKTLRGPRPARRLPSRSGKAPVQRLGTGKAGREDGGHSRPPGGHSGGTCSTPLPFSAGLWGRTRRAVPPEHPCPPLGTLLSPPIPGVPPVPPQRLPPEGPPSPSVQPSRAAAAPPDPR